MTDPRSWPTGEQYHPQPGAGAGSNDENAGPVTAIPVEQILVDQAAEFARDAPPDDLSPDPPTAPGGKHRSPKGNAPANRGSGEEPPISIADAVREQLGGVRGLVESSLPVLVFIVVNLATALKPALWAAVGSAVLVALYRLVRHDPIRHAVNGLLAVGVAAFLAARTGRAADFYILNILRNSAGTLLLLGSVLIRRPLIGYVWRFVAVLPADWRERPRMARTFSMVTLVWAAMFAIRAAVQIPLWLHNNANALGVVSVALGWPLFGTALAVTVWAGRRSIRTDDAARATVSAPPR